MGKVRVKQVEDNRSGELIAVNCWKVEKAADGETFFITLFDKEKTLYKMVTKKSCPVKAQGFYLLKPKNNTPKTFATSGKPYRALSGVFVAKKLTKEQYYTDSWKKGAQSGSGEVYEALYAEGEVVYWIAEEERYEGVIMDGTYDRERASWIYSIKGIHPLRVVFQVKEEKLFTEEREAIA